jgi:SAM-dependent methyltransferase
MTPSGIDGFRTEDVVIATRMEDPVSPRPACPLCGGSRSRVTSALSGRELRRLWEAFGFSIHPAAWGPLTPDRSVELYQCEECGFQFFDPVLVGSEDFYRVLERPGYYSPERIEFGDAVRFAQRLGLRRILDVGCGDGAFLDMAVRAGLRVTGLELNRVAAEKATAKGHQILPKLLHELGPEDVDGGFDLITLFQVVEHLADPKTAIMAAKGLLTQGGHIAVAVPSAEGINRLSPMSPYDWPPHHVSRWRRRDLQTLAKQCGMRVTYEPRFPMFGSDIDHGWSIREVATAALAGRVAQPAPIPLRFVTFLYRKLGMKYVFRRSGISIAAYFSE